MRQDFRQGKRRVLPYTDSRQRMGAMADETDEPEGLTLDQINQRSLIDYVVDRIEAAEDTIEVLDSGEVVITIGATASTGATRRQRSPSR